MAAVLGDSERVVRSLEKAFVANNRNSFIALRLAVVYDRRGLPQQAVDILQKALAANNAEKRLHYAMAKLLMKSDTAVETLLYHLQRSFSEGDSNYDAQVLYGRQLFLKGDFESYRGVFRRLSQARIGPQYRSKLLYEIENQSFQGKVSKLETSYCFIARDGSGDWVYSRAGDIDEEVWENLVVGARVEFRIGFNIRGATAFDVHIVGRPPEPRGDQLKLFKKAAVR